MKSLKLFYRFQLYNYIVIDYNICSQFVPNNFSIKFNRDRHLRLCFQSLIPKFLEQSPLIQTFHKSRA